MQVCISPQNAIAAMISVPSCRFLICNVSRLLATTSFGCSCYCSTQNENPALKTTPPASQPLLAHNYIFYHHQLLRFSISSWPMKLLLSLQPQPRPRPLTRKSVCKVGFWVVFFICLAGKRTLTGDSAVTVDYTLNNPDVISKYKDAAGIAHRVLEAVVKLAVEGATVLSLCQEGDKLLDEETQKVYKGKKISKGMTLPRSVCI